MSISKRAAVASLVILPIVAAAAPDTDEIVVVGRAVTSGSARIEVQREILVDTATALKDIPGANVNRNGVITGIAQYRGMFGDRVAVDIDQLGVISGGPNAMDSPLSYMSPMMTQDIVVARGIPSVSLAPETIGGHVSATTARGEFGSNEFGVSGMLGTRFATNGDISTSVVRLTFADTSHRISAVAESDNGSNVDTPAGAIRPSGIDRDRYDVSYAYANGDNRFIVFAGKLDTGPTGTPALPMDITFIDTELFGTRFAADIRPDLFVEGRFSYNDVSHVMDNHSQRQAPAPTRHRLNTTSGKGAQFYLAGTWQQGASELRLGVDGIAAQHESVITNPSNVSFRVDNFVDVERDLLGAFTEWVLGVENGQVEIGLRYNRVDTDAGDVGAAGMMGEMGQNVAQLAAEFNSAKRALRWSYLDGVLKYRRFLAGTTEWSLEIGRKSRAPSYQELYLWLPLQATGGLADGRNYVGNLGLEQERSNEIVLGLSLSGGPFAVSPQVFYKSVDDYIQGVPSTNAVANMLSTMMMAPEPLQFENVDAEIWGFDMAWRYDLTERLFLDGTVTAVRGRRTDADDDLYRLSPFNASIGLTYGVDAWSLRSEVFGYADQDHVSSYNDEMKSSGYWRANIGFVWNPIASLRVEARIDNLFDERYQDHVTGVNRAAGGDIPVGVRLYGAERNLSVGLAYEF